MLPWQLGQGAASGKGEAEWWAWELSLLSIALLSRSLIHSAGASSRHSRLKQASQLSPKRREGCTARLPNSAAVLTPGRRLATRSNHCGQALAAIPRVSRPAAFKVGGAIRRRFLSTPRRWSTSYAWL